MAVPTLRPLPIATISTTAEPCCPELDCRYMPKRVRWLMETIDEIKRDGQMPSEALASYMSTDIERERSRGRFFGPARQWAADLVADIEMAQQAGCRDYLDVARYLCPFAIGDEARVQAATQPVDQMADERVS